MTSCCEQQIALIPMSQRSPQTLYGNCTAGLHTLASIPNSRAHTHSYIYIYIQCIILSPCVLCDWFISLSFSIQGMYRTIVAISAISTAISTISTSRISGHSHDRSWLQEPVPVLSSGPFRSSQGAQPQRSFAQRQPDVIGAPSPWSPWPMVIFRKKPEHHKISQDYLIYLDITCHILS